MPQVFAFKGRDINGKLVSGRVEAEDQGSAIMLLREKSVFVFEIRPVRNLSIDLHKLLAVKIKTRDMAVFCRQFATMSEAGIPLLQCLNILVKQTENRILRKILQQVAVDVEKGRSLSESFRAYKDYLPEVFLNMVLAGEISGTMDLTMARLALHFEKEHEMREKVKSAMTYPLVIAGMAFIAVMVLIVLIVPVFVDIFNSMGAQLPLPTRILIGVSSFLIHYWYVVFLGSIALGVGGRRAVNTEKGRKLVDRLLLRLPVLGQLLNKTIVARFARTFATMIRSGVPLIQSMETLEKVSGNSVAAQEIAAARENIREGDRMAPVLMQSKIFPPMAVSMIAIGEESGTIDEMLDKLASFYEMEVQNMITRLSSIMEPLLIAGVGIIVAFIAISIYLPLFRLGGVMGGGIPGGGM